MLDRTFHSSSADFSSVTTSPGSAVRPHGSEVPVFLGTSPAAMAVRREIESAARTNAKVLILGETGVGKEVVARMIHAQSVRRARPLVPVNCSGIPETLLESELFGHVRGSFTGAYRDKVGLVSQANRGTLFLDELGEMSLRMQATLLRFTETGEIQPVGADVPTGCPDVRLITATNRDLRASIEAGAFREDLYYRLNVIQISVPPLRHRREDLMLLLHHYLEQASAAHSLPSPQLTAPAEEVLLAYSWPGNVRELKNTAERLVVADRRKSLTPEDLPREIRDSQPKVATLGERTSNAPRGLAADTPSETASRLWTRLMAGESFWDVVHQAFKTRELTRADLVTLIDLGLRQTRGSYRGLVAAFNLPPSDYRRFHAFLYQQRCNLPVAPYRRQLLRAPMSDGSSQKAAS